jgi:hypothetical protein
LRNRQQRKMRLKKGSYFMQKAVITGEIQFNLGSKIL